MTKQFKAKFKYIRISPLKLRRIVNLVRRKDCNTSLAVLGALPHKGARIVQKIVRSALASAKNDHVENKNLVISEIYADGAGMLKRHRAQSRGRAAPIKKRMSHLSIVIGEK